MAFLSFLLLAGVAYLIWRISDQLPDVIFRVSEIQRDVAEIRRSLGGTTAEEKPAAAPTASPAPASKPETKPAAGAPESTTS
jgi:hypothetical protein